VADWNKPTTTSNYYTEVLPELMARDFDAVSLLKNAPTNPADGMIKLVRSPVKFQERVSGIFTDLLLDITGGGTGAANATDARTNLGLGTMAVQNSSAVSISGGTIAGDGSGLTSLNATSLSSGTIPDARFPATLPAVNGSLLTNINGSAIASGTVPAARLGSGSGGSTKFLREDNTWQDTMAVRRVVPFTGVTTGGGIHTVNCTLTPNLTDYTKAAVVFCQFRNTSASGPSATITSNSNVAVVTDGSSGLTFNGYVVEWM